ncbi:hypothetical protein [Anatilimnocola floriformis]|uniref:hypothetical protein n=1 Tax=Anatilimnocola floriformis TaxID=2948575 RepID=UPI0020C3D901|nr:hypothetical protein [Anatilimnocola floriformis]
MNVVYYDNLEPSLTDEATAIIEVERIYCLDWDSFSEPYWQELTRIYDNLPGTVRFPEPEIPWWFGQDEDTPPFLWASVEPPGLQVYGVLPLVDWLAWDNRFQSLAAKLPMRVLK